MLPIMSTLLPKLAHNELQSLYSEISNYKIKSNAPQVYLLVMYKDYCLKVLKGQDERMMETISTIVGNKPKLLAKLK